MADTKRSVVALKVLLADNTSGDISPQDVRDFLVTALGVTGSIVTPLGSTTGQALTADTWTKCTLFTEEQSLGVTASHADDRLTMPIAGTYFGTTSFSMESTAPNVTFEFALYLDGVITELGASRKVSTANDVGSASFAGLAVCTTNQYTELWVKASANTNLVFKSANFTAFLVG
jgi:hypothetical protein